MKIVAVLNTRLGAGGGFDQGLNAVLQMQRLCAGRHGFEVLTSESANVEVLGGLGIAAQVFTPSWKDRALARFSLSNTWQTLQLRLKLIGPLERQLQRMGCDLAYFVAPDSTSACLQKLNFICTVWDVCHRDHPEFPEVRDFNEIFVRERYYQQQIHAATLVITASRSLSDSMTQRFGIDPARLLPMPFAPSPFLDAARSLGRDEVAAAHGLHQPYFFYPAQFWAHKNHVRVLQALALLKQQGHHHTVVFTGKDYGNQAHVQQVAAELGVAGQVRCLGFVPAGHMRGLYEGALALVMPTYFGPTNLPPLEAWALGKPLVYSAHLAEQVGEAALLADVDDAPSLAAAMLECTQAAARERLVAAGAVQLQKVQAEREAAEAALARRLDAFAARRACWPR